MFLVLSLRRGVLVSNSVTDVRIFHATFPQGDRHAEAEEVTFPADA